MLNCNSCKNPISVTSIHCEWCGEKIIRVEEIKSTNNGKNSESTLIDFMDKLNDVENEIIKENDGAGTWGALDGMLTRAFGSSKIDSLNQKKATIIKTFPLPKHPDDLLEICNLSVSNFKHTTVHKVALTDKARNENKINKPIKDAWKTKAEQAINQLTIYSRTDDFIRQQVELLKLELIEDKKGWFKKN